MTKRIITLIIYCILFGTSNAIYSQDQNVIAGLIRDKVNEEYIFPETGEKVVTEINILINNKVYTKLSNGQLRDTLTADLQNITKDLHLRVFYNPNKTIEKELSEEEKEVERLQSVNASRNENFGFEKLEILKGNIGYLKFNYFSTWEEATSTVHSSMNFLSNSKAIIIDLRDNGGGDTRMIQTIYSYLSGSDREHIYSIFYRKDDKEEQYWTVPHLPGKRYPETPVYVLTSSYTFSAAEALAYAIKHKNRGKVIGEITAGGAHPVQIFNISNGFSVMIPTKRAILPETNGNWEKVGVTPDVMIQADSAFDKAYLMAIEDLLIKEESKEYLWIKNRLLGLMKPSVLQMAELKKYVGRYENRMVNIKDDVLFYQREGSSSYPLVPIGNDRFLIREKFDYLIEFERDHKGIIVKIKLIFQDGSVSESVKSN